MASFLSAFTRLSKSPLPFRSCQGPTTHRSLPPRSPISIVLTTHMSSSAVVSGLAKPMTAKYSVDVPEDTPREELPDGSVLIHRHHASMAAKTTELSQLLEESSSSPPSPPSPSPLSLPPKLTDKPHKSYLTRSQITEIRTLRAQDTAKWTVSALSRKYNIAPLFVARISKTSDERKEQLARETEDQWKQWGVPKKAWRLERLRRRELW